MGYDRNDILARIELDQLCDELLGPRKGRGSSATWPCPDAHHGPQTGHTPPVTVFRVRDGTERWHCHGCGAGGTAVDLVMRTEAVRFPEAIELLGRRTGAATEVRPWASRPPRVRPEPPAPPGGDPSPALEDYVSACEDWLWGPNGTAMRRFLAKRSLGEDVLRANRVGADPGPRALPREDGLPRLGAAVVFPLFDDQGRVAYLQARYLSSNGRKYDNPSASLVPASPRLGEVRMPGLTPSPRVVLVCEGIPDALTAAQVGHRAVAVLGAGLPDERLAQSLAERYPDERLVLAFDADHRGRAGAERLSGLLEATGAGRRVGEISVPEEFGDLNAWVQAAGIERFAEDLGRAVAEHDLSPVFSLGEKTTPLARPGLTAPGGSVADALELDDGPIRAGDQDLLDELLETLAYQHLLLDDREAVARNVEMMTEALADWRASGDGAGPPVLGKDSGGIADLLDRIGYAHVLLDDKEAVSANLERISGMVERCSGPLSGDSPGTCGAADDLEVILAGMAEAPGLDGPALGL